MRELQHLSSIILIQQYRELRSLGPLQVNMERLNPPLLHGILVNRMGPRSQNLQQCCTATWAGQESDNIYLCHTPMFFYFSIFLLYIISSMKWIYMKLNT